MEREVKEGQIYKHFKGHIVKIICIAKNTETMEDEVIYEHQVTKEMWARPLTMFNSKVDKQKYPDVNQEYRFELMEKEGE